jgi:hypothetical protein
MGVVARCGKVVDKRPVGKSEKLPQKNGGPAHFDGANATQSAQAWIVTASFFD